MGRYLCEPVVGVIRIEKEHFEKDLFKLFENDADLTGENGESYISTEAKENGFKCDLDFFISETIRDKGISEEAIEYFIEKIFNSSSYWIEYKSHIEEISEKTFIAVYTAICQ